MRFDGADDSLQVASPPSLAGGVTVFVAYRIRSHVNGQGILAAGKAGDGQGNDKWFEFSSTFSANRTQLVAKDTQANPIITAQRVDPRGDKNYAVFKIDAANAELRDFLGAVTDTGTSLAFSGVPDLIAIGACAFNQFATSPFGNTDLYEVGLYTRPLAAGELDQLEAYLKSQHAVVWSPGYLDTALAWWHDDWSPFSLTGSLVDQWNDRSGNGRHWLASAAARPEKTTATGSLVVRHDGIDDVMALTGTLPVLQPFTVAVIYRVRDRDDFRGVLSAATASGVDHTTFWTFELALAASNALQLYGRSEEAVPLALTRPDSGGVQIALWTVAAGNASLRDASAEVAGSYGGSFGTPAAIVLGARYDGSPFNHAAVDVMATVGVSSALATPDQLKLIGWASARWGV
jgi:hypothetical protein